MFMGRRLVCTSAANGVVKLFKQIPSGLDRHTRHNHTHTQTKHEFPSAKLTKSNCRSDFIKVEISIMEKPATVAQHFHPRKKTDNIVTKAKYKYILELMLCFQYSTLYTNTHKYIVRFI